MCKAWQLIFSCFSLCALVKRCFSTFIVTCKNPFQISFADGIFAFQPMFSYGQRSKCADLLNSYFKCISTKRRTGTQISSRDRVPVLLFYPLFYPETFIRSLRIFAESIPFSWPSASKMCWSAACSPEAPVLLHHTIRIKRIADAIDRHRRACHHST